MAKVKLRLGNVQHVYRTTTDTVTERTGRRAQIVPTSRPMLKIDATWLNFRHRNSRRLGRRSKRLPQKWSGYFVEGESSNTNESTRPQDDARVQLVHADVLSGVCFDGIQIYTDKRGPVGDGVCGP